MKETQQIDWNEISQRPNLNRRFIEKHVDKLNLVLVMQRNRLNDEFFEKFASQINWAYFAERGRIQDKYIDVACLYLENHAAEVDWYLVTRNPLLQEEILLRFIEYINLNWLTESRYLSDLFLKQTIDRLDLQIATRYQSLSSELIDRIAETENNYQIWVNLAAYQNLSEDFILKYADKLDFLVLSSCQSLTESIIEKFAEQVDWYEISRNQKLSHDFLIRHANELDWKMVCKKQQLSEDIVEQYIHKVDWEALWKYQDLPDSFWARHSDMQKQLNSQKQ